MGTHYLQIINLIILSPLDINRPKKELHKSALSAFTINLVIVMVIHLFFFSTVRDRKYSESNFLFSARGGRKMFFSNAQGRVVLDLSFNCLRNLLNFSCMDGSGYLIHVSFVFRAHFKINDSCSSLSHSANKTIMRSRCLFHFESSA